MPVIEVTRFTDNKGRLHPTREIAEHANGLDAVSALLSDQVFSPEQQDLILSSFQDWYLAYLGGKQ